MLTAYSWDIVSKARQEALSAIDRGMVRIRRSQGRRTVGRQLQKELGRRLNLSHIFVADALAEIAESGDPQASVGQVGETLGIDPSRASRMTAGAIRAGLVKRIASQQDGRRSELQLTGQGRGALATVRRFRMKFFARLTAEWPDRDCADFARLLTRFTETMAHDPSRAGFRKNPRSKGEKS